MAEPTQLTGTPEEQADQLYEMAEEAMSQGRYSGAYRYWLEIEKALPGYRDVPQRLAEANRARREQRFLIMGALLGAAILVFVARTLGTQSELVLFGAAVAGLLVGWLISLLLFSGTSLMSQWYFGFVGLNYMFGRMVAEKFKYIFPCFCIFGATLKSDMVWTIQDIALGLLTIPNLIAMIFLWPKVRKATKEFFGTPHT